MRPALEAAAFDADETLAGYAAQDATGILLQNWLDALSDSPGESLTELSKDVDDVMDELSRFQQRVREIGKRFDHDEKNDDTPKP